jgi:hypothetical protein
MGEADLPLKLLSMRLLGEKNLLVLWHLVILDYPRVKLTSLYKRS